MYAARPSRFVNVVESQISWATEGIGCNGPYSCTLCHKCANRFHGRIRNVLGRTTCGQCGPRQTKPSAPSEHRGLCRVRVLSPVISVANYLQVDSEMRP